MANPPAAEPAPGARVVLADTGLFVSRVGFGTYRVDDQHPTFAQALERALAAGCNLVDTSTNYTDGGSERCVGNVIAARAGERPVVVTKIGYVQGQNLALALAREEAGRPFPEMVRYTDGCWHCIHPDFLAEQLDASLARLRLGAVDVCLLHNPEYFFSDAVHRGASPAELPGLRDEFYRRLEAAFAFFERQVAAGRLRAYGVSSNTAAAPEGDADMTSLARMWQAATAAGGPGHHFRVLQLPMNPLETGALYQRNNDGRTVLALAQELGVAVLVNRPLNAIADGRLVRFSQPLAPQLAPAFDAVLPPEHTGATLSQKTLHVLTSVPGVTAVLLGMRRPAYVDDGLAVLDWPPLPLDVIHGVFGAFADLRR